ncbi:7583_t:CDS:2 [Ambispora leptoticha]|uniref:7583_t:CDS:1 n=1 Tax=Ambispora leptoticha TaxID=144679 RepID=A0A9N9BY03_9GLOM|nr:7583_t:CDS:2 [Ambispora leptoticha]
MKSGEKELKGELNLDEFTNLENLCIRQKEISNIRLENNASLVELVISGSEIKELSLNSQLNLKLLSISDANRLLFIDLSQNINLTSFLVEYCKELKKIDGLDKITKLTFSSIKNNPKLMNISDYEKFCIPNTPQSNIGLPKAWKDFFDCHLEEINSRPKKDGRGCFSFGGGESEDSSDEETESSLQEKNNDEIENESKNNYIYTNTNDMVQLGDESDEESDDVFFIFTNGSSYRENFAVVSGCDEEFLLFNRDFFAGTECKDSFQKGKIYKLCFSGELKKDSNNVIKSVEGGGFEINEISEVISFVRNTYKEKEKILERKNAVEKELQEKSNTIQEINKDRFEAKKELADLKIKFDSLQFEKTRLESERITPEKYKELLDIQKDLKTSLAAIKEENKALYNQLEKIEKQD